MKGFSLVEVLVVIIILSLIIGTVYSIYGLSQKAFQEGEISAELTQNGRVVLERITREIRQARDIATDLSVDVNDAVNYIEFEDGHIEERYYYIRYFQEGNELKREIKRYYFSGDLEPYTYVAWNAVSLEGKEILPVYAEEAKTIGELIQELKFWSPEIKMVNISVILGNNAKQLDFLTAVFGRNL